MKKNGKHLQHILILGGGFGGLNTYKNLHRFIHRKNKALISIVDRNNYFLFTPMLHEVATGSVERSHIVQPLREVTQCCLEKFVQAEVTGIDLAKKKVFTTNGSSAEINYDYLVFALGSAVNYYGVPGAAEHAFTLKNMQDAVRLRNHIIAVFEEATKEANAKRRRELLHFVIVGGGPTGVEMAGQLADLVFKAFRPLYQEIDYSEVKITLLHQSERLLHVLTATTGERALSQLRKRGVAVRVQTSAKEISATSVLLSTGEKLASATTIWTAGVSSVATKFFDTTLLNKYGQILVTPELHIPDMPNVFVLGDAAATDGVNVAFAPQTAQAASAAAKIVAHNISQRLFCTTPRMRTFSFRQRGYIIPIGDWYAAAEIGPFSFGGRFAWWLRRTVFVQNLTSWMNRLRVIVDWTVGLFLPRDTSQL